MYGRDDIMKDEKTFRKFWETCASYFNKSWSPKIMVDSDIFMTCGFSPTIDRMQVISFHRDENLIAELRRDDPEITLYYWPGQTSFKFPIDINVNKIKVFIDIIDDTDMLTPSETAKEDAESICNLIHDAMNIMSHGDPASGTFRHLRNWARAKLDGADKCIIPPEADGNIAVYIHTVHRDGPIKCIEIRLYLAPFGEPPGPHIRHGVIMLSMPLHGSPEAIELPYPDLGSGLVTNRFELNDSIEEFTAENINDSKLRIFKDWAAKVLS